MIGFDLEGNVMGGPGSLGDEGGSDSAGLYDPTKAATAETAEELYANRRAAMKAAGVTFGTKAYKDWDAKTRAAMGVKKGDKFSSGQWMETFGGMSPSEINAYEGDAYLSPAAKIGMNKFKQDASSIMSGVSIPSLSGMKQFYLDDESSFKVGQVKEAKPFDRWDHVRSAMNVASRGRYGNPNVQYVKEASEFWGGKPPGSTYNPAGVNPYGGELGRFESLGTPLNTETWKEEQGYFNDLTAAYPSFRAPSPHGGGKWNAPSSAQYDSKTGQWSPIAGTESGQYSEIVPFASFPVTNEEGITTVYDVEGNVINRYEGQPTRTGEQSHRDSLRARQQQLYGSPDYVRRGGAPYTFPGQDNEMFGFEEPMTALPAFYDEETAASFNKRFAGTRYGKVKPGDPFLNPYTPYGDQMLPTGNIGMTTTGISGGAFKPGEILPQNYLPTGTTGEYFSTGTFDPVRRPDMLKILQGSPDSVLIHEKYHGAQRAIAENSVVWRDKIMVENTPFDGATTALIDIISSSWGWDLVAMHAAIYAGSHNMLPKDIEPIMNHSMFMDIDSNTSLSDNQKYSMKVARAKKVSKAMNDASQLILDSDYIQQRPTARGIQSDWGSQWKNPGG